MVVRVGPWATPRRRPNLVRVSDDRVPLSHPGEATMAQLIASAKKFVVAEEGASLVEYGLLIALIAVVCIGGITALGGGISTMLGGLGTTIGNVNTSSS